MIKLFNQYFRVPYLLLAIFEFFIALLAVNIATSVRMEMTGWHGISLPSISALFFGTALVLGMMSMGLYQSRSREGLEGVIVRMVLSYVASTVALSVFFYMFPAMYLGRGVLGLALVFSFFGMTLSRILFLRLVDEQLLKRQVLVLGAGKRAANIFRAVRRKSDQRGFNLLGCVHVSGERDDVSAERLLKFEGALNEYVISQGVDEVVVAIDDRRQNYPLDELLDIKLGGVEVVDVLTFFEREMGKIDTDLLRPGWIIYSDGFNRGVLRSMVERTFDLLASFAILLALWPVMCLTILLIRLESGAGATFFYKQTRVGLDGELFDVLKFRSMRENAETAGAVWAQENDARITRVGAFIRKYRIDELPQCLNVLKGDMSFVGPRPERPEFVGQLEDKIPYYRERHRVKPGITGWAQLCYPYGSTDEDAKQKLQYDLYYVKNHNLLLDLTILIQTVEVVLFGKGAR